MYLEEKVDKLSALLQYLFVERFYGKVLDGFKIDSIQPAQVRVLGLDRELVVLLEVLQIQEPIILNEVPEFAYVPVEDFLFDLERLNGTA